MHIIHLVQIIIINLSNKDRILLVILACITGMVEASNIGVEGEGRGGFQWFTIQKKAQMYEFKK